MLKILEFLKKKKIIIEIIAVLILAFYISSFDASFYSYLTDEAVGSLDSTAYIRALDDASYGKTPYKDFYWGYGPLFLFIQLPAYIFLGANHGALMKILYSYLPFISVIMSFVIAAIFFRASYFRLLFVIISIFQYSNNTYFSFRHLVAETALAVFLFSLDRSANRRLIFISGILSGTAILASHEYGLSVIFTILVGVAIIDFFSKRRYFKQIIPFYLFGIAALLCPFYLYLLINGAFLNYFKYLYGLTINLGNPASNELLPLLSLPPFVGIVSFAKSMLNFSISKDFRFYVPLLIYFSAIIYSFCKFSSKDANKPVRYFFVAIYGLVIFLRILSGPAFSAWGAYALMPAIIIGILFFQYLHSLIAHNIQKKNIRNSTLLGIIAGVIYIWLFATTENRDFYNFSGILNKNKTMIKNTTGKIYYDKVGYAVSPHAYQQFKDITEYIELHTSPREYVLVYPWGPYNNFTKRPSPLTARYDCDLAAGKYFKEEAVSQMEKRKPRYVVLNTFNGLSMVALGGKRGDAGDSITWGTPDSPCFAGRGDELQKYILENYVLEKKFDYAAILVRMATKREFVRNFTLLFEADPQKLRSYNLSKIKDRNTRLEYLLDKPILCSHIEVVFNVLGGFWTRPLSKSFVRISLLNNNEEISSSTYLYDLRTFNIPQTAWLGFGGGATRMVDKIKISIDTPGPYFLPGTFEINSIKILFENVPDAIIKPPNSPVLIEAPITVEPQQNNAVQIDVKPDDSAESGILDKIIASTFKTLGKTFVLVTNIENLKKQGLKKLNKMSEEKFKKKYAETYPFIKDLPSNIKVKYGVSENMAKEKAMQNVKTLTKEDMYKLMDSFPDFVIVNNFKLYLKSCKTDLEKNNVVQQIGQIWQKMTANHEFNTGSK